MLNPFTPGGPSASVSATTSTGRAAITRGSSQQVMVSVAAGGQTAFIKFGDDTVVAATTDTPVPAGAQKVFSVAPDVTHIAAITASSTATVYATPGNGQ